MRKRCFLKQMVLLVESKLNWLTESSSTSSVTVTSLHSPRLCRFAVFSVKPTSSHHQQISCSKACCSEVTVTLVSLPPFVSQRGLFNTSSGFLRVALCLPRVALLASALSPCPSLCVGGGGFLLLLLEPN